MPFPFPHAQEDLSLARHGFVKVTYNKTLLPPEEGQPAFHPFEPDSDGRMVTAAQGFRFMVPYPQVDMSTPAEMQSWKHGDVGDAEGLGKKEVWQKTKVLTDIVEHRMADAPEAQRDQWKAIAHFHNSYKTSGEVLPLPLALRAGTPFCMFMLCCTHPMLLACRCIQDRFTPAHLTSSLIMCAC